jgi:crotonobetainyl-CoA:carnitine CoA-transferase CaiB-like acyl-CoA transferase
VFTCEGGVPVALAVAGEDHHWTALCRELGLNDDAALDASERATRCDELRVRVAAACATRTAEDLIRRLDDLGVSCAPVRSPEEVLDDPQVVARGMFIDTPEGRAVRQPILVDGSAILTASAAPRLDEDGRDQRA